jgi:excisionase family DNA binding protein
MRGPRTGSLPRLLTVSEVAERLHFSRGTIYAWAASGRLPCHRLGRQIRFDEGDLIRWLEAQEAQKEGRPNA